MNTVLCVMLALVVVGALIAFRKRLARPELHLVGTLEVGQVARDPWTKGFRDEAGREEPPPVDAVRLAWIDQLVDEGRARLAKADPYEYARLLAPFVELVRHRERFAAGDFGPPRAPAAPPGQATPPCPCESGKPFVLCHGDA